MRPKLTLLILGGLAISAGIGIALTLIFGYLNNSERNNLAVGSTAPDFILDNFLGEDIQLSDFRGSPVLINFWATWCQPCRIEMPYLQERHEYYPSELVVLAINFDESANVVQSFAEELNLTFNILLDPAGRVQDLFQIKGYPTTYFIDSEGFIRVIHIGLLTESQLDDYLIQVGVGG
jgi:peroxiredoxin